MKKNNCIWMNTNRPRGDVKERIQRIPEEERGKRPQLRTAAPPVHLQKGMAQRVGAAFEKSTGKFGTIPGTVVNLLTYSAGRHGTPEPQLLLKLNF